MKDEDFDPHLLPPRLKAAWDTDPDLRRCALGYMRGPKIQTAQDAVTLVERLVDSRDRFAALNRSQGNRFRYKRRQ